MANEIRRHSFGCLATAIALAALLGACDAPIAPTDGGVDAAPSPVPPTDQLDLLISLDVSNAACCMTYALTREIPRVLAVLTSGDRDHDGVIDFTPVRSVHVAFVTSDMGIGSALDPTACTRPGGDDGIFLTQRRPGSGGTGCVDDPAAGFPHGVFTWDREDGTPIAAFAQNVACLPYQPSNFTRGCGYQAPLEAALKSLSPAPRADGTSPVSWTAPGYRPPTFVDGSFGHGTDATTNGSFLRPDSVLAILVVSAVEEHATPNPQLYSNDPEFADVTPAWRAYRFDEQQYPDARWVDGLLGLRTAPSRVVFSLIAGVPIALEGAPPTEILADPSMAPQFFPQQPEYPAPSCVSPVGGPYGNPARRMTRVARDLIAAGGRASVYSICASNDQPAYDALIDQVIAAMAGTP